MHPIYFAQLILLAAIWGSSFMFMRIAVPALGPTWMLEIRLFSAALFLLLVTRLIGQALDAGRYWRHYLILGLFNTALPFFVFAWAARELPASTLAILNSTAPLWGLVIGFVWRGKPISPRAILGLLFGAAGVASLVGLGGFASEPGQLSAALLAASAAVFYGIASSYAEYAERVPPFANAHGSLWAAALLMLPLAPFSALPASWPAVPVLSALALGVVCSGVAYLLYYNLITKIGATSALTVGYLIPLFGVLWGWLFLNEAIGWHTLAGAALVLTGTALVTGMNPVQLLSRWGRR
jgi:drug/metabolite transporter (DMT)-like permease